MSVIERLSKQAVADAALIAHLRDEAKQHKDAYLAMREENGIIRQQLQGAVDLLSELWGAVAEGGTGHMPTPESKARLERAMDAAQDRLIGGQ